MSFGNISRSHNNFMTSWIWLFFSFTFPCCFVYLQQQQNKTNQSHRDTADTLLSERSPLRLVELLAVDALVVRHPDGGAQLPDLGQQPLAQSGHVRAERRRRLRAQAVSAVAAPARRLQPLQPVRAQARDQRPHRAHHSPHIRPVLD